MNAKDNGGGNWTLTGCRLHAEDSDCQGALILKESIYGAQLMACEKAWAEKDYPKWS